MVIVRIAAFACHSDHKVRTPSDWLSTLSVKQAIFTCSQLPTNTTDTENALSFAVYKKHPMHNFSETFNSRKMTKEHGCYKVVIEAA